MFNLNNKCEKVKMKKINIFLKIIDFDFGTLFRQFIQNASLHKIWILYIKNDESLCN